MAKTTPGTKLCKYCKTEIPKAAKVCPQCGRRQKKPVGLIILLIFVVLIAFVISRGCGGSSDDGPKKTGTVGSSEAPGTQAGSEASGKTESQAPGTEVPAQTTFAVGDIVEDGNLRIVYAAAGPYTEDNQFLQPAEGKRYIFLKFSFENIGTSDTSISGFSFEGYADGYTCDAYYGGEDDLSATLSPGRATIGYLYFEVPADAKQIEVEYTPNVFNSSKKITFLYEEKDSGYVPDMPNVRTEGAFAVGDIVESEKLRITYVSCEDFTSDNQFIQPKPGYHFVTCTFEFENLGSSDEHVSYFDFDCFADGLSCDQNYMRDDNLSATISAGRKAKGTVTFAIPDNCEVAEVEFVSDYWSSKRVVFTVK